MAASYDTLLSILSPKNDYLKTEHDKQAKVGFNKLYTSLLKFSLKKTPSTLKALDNIQDKVSSLANLENQIEEEFNHLESDRGMIDAGLDKIAEKDELSGSES
jgi:hypothetical protein